MKTIGIIGGMSWESSAEYYRLINEGVKQAKGGLSSAKMCLYSLDFQEIANLQKQEKWQKMAEILSGAARSLEAAGADFLLIATNTMHKVADETAQSVGIPLLHIADATGAKLQQAGITKVGLLGTRFTMEQDFYKQRLKDNFGITAIVPDANERQIIHDIIFNELCMGEINPRSKAQYLSIIQQLQKRGAKAIILGCTEISLLIKQKDTAITLFDTTQIHAMAAVEYSLNY